jgi:hemerythrin superfamily protein
MSTEPSNIFEALRADHEIQRELTDRLLQTKGDGEQRRKVYAELKRELVAHAEHEERQLYVPLMMHDLTQEKARHSVSEHKELDDFIVKLDEYDRSGAPWLTTAKELAERLVHHLDEEEHEVFQVAGKVLTEDQKTDLGRAYAASMAETRAS